MEHGFKMSLAIACVLSGLMASQSGAALIGQETFDYGNGSVLTSASGSTPGNWAGGTGWNRVSGSQSASTSSSWTSFASNDADKKINAVGQMEITAPNGGSALRFYGPDKNTAGAGTNTALYISFDMVITNNMSDAGIVLRGVGYNAYRFAVVGGVWTLSVRNGNGGDWGSGLTNVATGTAASANTLYHVIAAVEPGANGKLKLWVNPDASDYNSASSSSADLVYTGTTSSFNDNVAVAVGSTGTSSWDNIKVATTAAEVGLGAVPEPATFGVLALAGFGLLARRRKSSTL